MYIFTNREEVEAALVVAVEQAAVQQMWAAQLAAQQAEVDRQKQAVDRMNALLDQIDGKAEGKAGASASFSFSLESEAATAFVADAQGASGSAQNGAHGCNGHST
jgi:hypothetical protein